MGGLFGSGKGVSNTAPVISSIQLQTSSFGRAIPWIFGQQRVAPNLIQYEDFTAIAHTSQQKTGKGGGGKATNTEYTYTVAAAMALGTGTLASIGRVWKDKERTSLAELHLDYYNGTEAQEPYPYFVSKHPDRALSYRGIAYVASGAYDLGTSAGFGNHTFEVQAHNSVGEKHAGANVPDAEPVDVIMSVVSSSSRSTCMRVAMNRTFSSKLKNSSLKASLCSSLLDKLRETGHGFWSRRCISVRLPFHFPRYLTPGKEIAACRGYFFTLSFYCHSGAKTAPKYPI